MQAATDRTRAREILSQARQHVDEAEAAYRRDFLPTPSREHPRHDPAAIRNAQVIEGIGRDIGSLESQIRTFPLRAYPGRTSAQDADQALIDHAEFLRALLAPVDGGWIAANAGEVRGLVEAIRILLHENAFLPPGPS